MICDARDCPLDGENAIVVEGKWDDPRAVDGVPHVTVHLCGIHRSPPPARVVPNGIETWSVALKRPLLDMWHDQVRAERDVETTPPQP